MSVYNGVTFSTSTTQGPVTGTVTLSVSDMDPIDRIDFLIVVEGSDRQPGEPDSITPPDASPDPWVLEKTVTLNATNTTTVTPRAYFRDGTTFNADPASLGPMVLGGGGTLLVQDGAGGAAKSANRLVFPAGVSSVDSGSGTATVDLESRYAALTAGRVLQNVMVGQGVLSATNMASVLDVSTGGTPINGYKIRTNIPQPPAIGTSGFWTVMLEGNNYAGGVGPVHLEIQFYAYNGGFVRYGATSLGEWAPNITLAYESGFAVIFLDSPAYFRHFHVRAYGKLASPASYQGWSWSDAAVAGDAVSPKSVPYGAVKFGATPTVGSTPLSLEGHTHAWSDITGAPVYATRWPTLAEIGAAAGSGFTINQNLRTTDAPSFAGLTLTGNLNNTTRFSFLNGAGGAQVIMTGGVLISNSYGDVSLVPTNGLWVKGDARFNGGSTGGIYIDGGWVRVLGNNGIWFETWAGGFHMEDSTYIRSNKSVLTTLDMVAARFVDVSNVGCYLDPAGTSVLETVQLVDRIRSTGATPISMDIAAGGNRYPYIEWKYGGVRGAYMGWGTPGTQLDLTLENGNKLAINGNVTVSGGFNVGANGIGTTGGITAAGDIETGGTLKDQWTESGGGIMIAHVISRSAAAGFDPNLSAPDGTFQAIWD